MNRIILTLLTLSFVVLACSLQVPPNAAPNAVSTKTPPTNALGATKTAIPNTPELGKTELADVTAIRSLNVRERAGEYERVIGALYFQDTVTLTGSCAHGWAEILWNSGTAWVNADYLTKNKCSEEK